MKIRIIAEIESIEFIKPETVGEVVAQDSVELPKKRKYKKRKSDGGLTAIVKRVRETKERRKKLGPEAEETIIEDIRDNDLGMADACKKYDISVATYYKLRNQSKSKEAV